MEEAKTLNLSIQIKGLKELSEKLDEMNLHIKKAISVAEEIAELNLVINREKDLDVEKLCTYFSAELTNLFSQ